MNVGIDLDSVENKNNMLFAPAEAMNTRLLEQAAALGHAEAQYALGTAYLMGQGVQQERGHACVAPRSILRPST